MKMKWLFLPVLFCVFITTACKQKKNTDFFPVIPFFNSQIQQVDTSVFNIVKLDKMETDSVYDTTYVHREQFRALAHDFLETPDITQYSIGKKYKEEKNFDESMNRLILTYTPVKDDNNLELIKQELLIHPDEYSGTGKITNVIIEKIKETKDSTVHQQLLWQADQKFQIVNTVEKKGQPAYTKTTEVIWNQQDQ